jgi:RNA exonuclease 1
LSRLLAIVIAAIDCEMVETTSGGGGSSGAKQSELARLSVVDASGRVLADVLVKPENVVTDYLTQWSGITAELL